MQFFVAIVMREAYRYSSRVTTIIFNFVACWSRSGIFESKIYVLQHQTDNIPQFYGSEFGIFRFWQFSFLLHYNIACSVNLSFKNFLICVFNVLMFYILHFYLLKSLDSVDQYQWIHASKVNATDMPVICDNAWNLVLPTEIITKFCVISLVLPLTY